MSSTIEEWLMSAEYIMAGGNENVIMCNSRGIICDGDEKLNPAQREIAKITNKGTSFVSLVL